MRTHYNVIVKGRMLFLKYSASIARATVNNEDVGTIERALVLLGIEGQHGSVTVEIVRTPLA